MAWIAAGAAIGGALLNKKSNDSASKKATNSIQFKPWNVSTGFGNSIFDYSNRSSRVETSPEYQKIRNPLLNNAANIFADSNLWEIPDVSQKVYDPNQSIFDYFSKTSQLANPMEQQQRYDLENRLFQQGRLGSTGGRNAMQALYDSQANQGLAREVNAMNYGQQYAAQAQTIDQSRSAFQQQLIDQILGRGYQALQGASNIDLQALKSLDLGGTFGGMASNAGANAAQYPWMAAQQNGAMMAGALTNLGNAIGSYQRPPPNQIVPPSSKTSTFGYDYGFTR